jgi:hypothetical protein
MNFPQLYPGCTCGGQGNCEACTHALSRALGIIPGGQHAPRLEGDNTDNAIPPFARPMEPGPVHTRRVVGAWEVQVAVREDGAWMRQRPGQGAWSLWGRMETTDL